MAKQVSYQFAVAATPHDTNVEPAGKFDAVYVGGAGNVTMLTGNAAILFTAPPVGSIIPCGGTRINATGTTATALVLLYGGN